MTGLVSLDTAAPAADAAAPAVAAPAVAAPAVAAPAAVRPEWLAEKFASVEDQAKAYVEAQKLIGRRDDETRAALRLEIEAEAKAGLPADATAYVMPEGLAAPDVLADAFKSKAHDLGMTQAQFDGMAALYAETQAVDVTAEKALLGVNADARIAALKPWAVKHIPAALHEQAAQMMRRAEGFEVFEALMRASMGGVMPNPEAVETAPRVTQDGYNAMLSDPRYADPNKRDPEYMRQVNAYAVRLAQASAR